MRVFVAGATGAIGRRLVPKLLGAGHEATGMTRSEERAAALRDAGATAVVVDVFDEQGVRRAMAEAAPDVLVHQLTSLPERLDYRDPSVFEPTNRVRTEGTRILLDAARGAGARRVVAQSVAFMYAPEGGPLKSEDDPLMPPSEQPPVAALLALEEAITGAEGFAGLVLRYGFFYGPGTYFAPGGSTAKEVRRRRFPVIGRGDGIFSWIHVDDAADATVAAVERGAPGIYNVVDDEPAPMHDWLPAYAEALGAKRPWRVPVFLARLVAGKQVTTAATSSRGASNEKAKRELGWSPRHASWRQGFRETLA